MAGGTVTTFYDVHTRFYSSHRGAAELKAYETSMMRAAMGTDKLQASTRLARRGFRALQMALLPLVGSQVLGLAGFAIAAGKSFGNLNRAMNSTITLAAQLNLGFKYTEDPAKNFVRSMRHARLIFRDLVKDAAALPGEVNDFLGIARMIGIPTFSAGGSTDQFRKMIGKIALAAPMVGADFNTAGMGAMQMLQGRGIRRNALTAFMQSDPTLLGGRTLEQFNALKAAERLRILDEGLSRLTDNPIFREEVLNTFDTQLGTLSETLFGTTGIGGMVFGEGFQDILTWLTEFNVTLEKNAPEIAVWLREVGYSMTDLFGMLARLPWEVITKPIALIGGVLGMVGGGQFGNIMEREREAGRLPHYPTYKAEDRGVGYLAAGQAQANVDYVNEVMKNENFIRMMKTDPAFIRDPAQWRKEHGVPWAEEGGAGIDGESRALAEPAKVTQNFHVKVAVSTDESPEVVAVKIRKALSGAAAHPTTTGRGVAALPGGGGGMKSA